MGMKKFKASPMPTPPKEYDSQFMTQVIRNLEQYFARLDSQTPIIAEEIEALKFIGDITNTTTQYADVSASIGQAAVAANTPEVIVLDTTNAISDRIEFDNSTLTFLDAGVYRAKLIMQVENVGVTDTNVNMGIVVDTVPKVTRSHTVADGGDVSVELEGIFTVGAGQEVQAMFETLSPTDVTIFQAQLICTWLSYK